MQNPLSVFQMFIQQYTAEIGMETTLQHAKKHIQRRDTFVRHGVYKEKIETEEHYI